MATTARWTKWDKAAQGQLSADLRRAFEHAEVRKAWRRAVLVFRELGDPASETFFPLTPTSIYMRDLVALLQQHAPLVVKVYGENLYKFIMSGVFWALGIPWPAEWEPTRDRLSPGHPLIRHEDGRYSGLEEMTVEHFYEFRDYERSKLPPKKRDPKPKPVKTPPTERREGKRSIDPVFATQAAALDADGYSLVEIAARLLPNDRIRNKKDYDRITKKIDRAIEKGKLLRQHKKSDAQF